MEPIERRYYGPEADEDRRARGAPRPFGMEIGPSSGGGDVWIVPGPHVGRGPKGYRRSDERIREDVCERLARDGDVDATDIEVTVADGEVTLSGRVDHRWTKRRAEDIAASVSGVRDVLNRVRVDPAMPWAS